MVYVLKKKHKHRSCLLVYLLYTVYIPYLIHVGHVKLASWPNRCFLSSVDLIDIQYDLLLPSKLGPFPTFSTFTQPENERMSPPKKGTISKGNESSSNH